MTRLAGVVAAIVALALAGYASGATMVTADDLRGWLPAFSGFAPVVFIALFAALNTIGVPAPVIVTVGGSVFGASEGAAISLVALSATACIQFLFTRRLGGERLRQRLGARLGRLGTMLERRGVLAVAAGRLLPGPFSELNMAAGLTPLAFRDFAIGTVLGCAPKAIAWSAVGAALR